MAMDTRISLQKLEIFCLVVELEGVGRAADHLFVSQPVVTAHLRTLQQRLGAKLFERQGRGMRLTEAGEVAYKWAKDVLTRSEEVSREIAGLAEGDGGQAVVAASMTLGSYVIPPVLSRFRREHPRARITLLIFDPERAMEAIETGTCDLAVVVTDAPLAPDAFNSQIIAHEELVLVAAVDAAVPSHITPDELERLPFVCSPGGLARRRFIDRALAGVGVTKRDVAIELGHPEAMKRATRDGLGVAMLFRSSVNEELEAGLLREVAIEGYQHSVPVRLVHRAAKRLSPLQETLASVLTESLSR
jgi:DNA-binding transcriptional LysR family regulator